MALRLLASDVAFDAIVIGAGMAGTCAALGIREAGRTVLVLADGAGATALSSGAIRPHPALVRNDLDRLLERMPAVLRAAPTDRPMRIPTAAGGVVEAVAAPADCLDLDSWPGKRIAVAAPALSGTLDAAALAALLRDAAGGSTDFLPVETVFSARAADAALTPAAATGRLRADPGFALEFERRLARSLAGTAPDAVLLAPWTTPGVRAAVERSAGVPAFVTLGTWGGPSRGRDLADALGVALRSSGADIRFPAAVEAVRPAGDSAGWVVACGGGDRFRART
ncbi:MAG: FAD-binding protein, partial [Myxococcota bacterium]|nr:FAD-binding protein [Myxococcota bacterium]